MFILKRFLIAVLATIFIGGCASYNPPAPEQEPRRPDQDISHSEDTGAMNDSEYPDSNETTEEAKADEITDKANEIEEVSARQTGDVVILTLDQKILFELGQAKIKRTAWPTLDEIAKLILEYPNRMVMVQGHTDDLPTRTERFPSNWDLSAQRAVNVVKYIANLPELEKSRLVAAGFGQFNPRVPNNSPENRKLNRRVEIVMYPSDLPRVTVPVPSP